MANRKILSFLIIAILLSMGSIEIVAYIESRGFQEWWMNIAVVSLVYGVPILVLFKSINKGHVFSNKQISGLFLILLALPIFGYALFGTTIPEISYSGGFVEILPLNDGNNSMAFSVVLDFSTIGSFSVENSIHAKVTIINSNVTDLTKYVGNVSFTGAFPVITETDGDKIPMNAYLNLTQMNNGEYSAEGDLIWHNSVSTHSVWLAPGTTYYNQGYWQQRGQDILNISPVADTLAFRSSHTMEQLTYVLVGFSVVMLYPIFEALFPDKPPKQRGEQTPQNQGEPYYKRTK